MTQPNYGFPFRQTEEEFSNGSTVYRRFMTFFWNVIYAILIFFLGGFGILIMRIFKGVWTNQLWSYIPIFWFPMVTSWVVSIAVLLGFFDI